MDAGLEKSIIRQGILSCPRYIPQWFRYDKYGSIYNDACLYSPYYYFHRAELDLLQNQKEIKDIVSNFGTLIDMGSGNSEKTKVIFDYVLHKKRKITYYPIDISEEFLMENCKELKKQYGSKMVIKPIAAEYKDGIKQLVNIKENKLIIWFGSMQSLALSDQIDMLERLSTVMQKNDLLLVTVDITLDKETIETAYLDPLGMGEKLYLNNIWRLNRDYGANINTGDFKVECEFVRDDSPDAISFLKVWLRAQKNISFSVPALNLTLNLENNETIFLHDGEGISCKYSLEQLSNIGRKAGLFVKASYTNKHAVLTLFSNDGNNLQKK